MLLPSGASAGSRLREISSDYVVAVRERLEADHWAGASGVETALRFSAAIDNLVRFVVDAGTERFVRRYALAHQRCAVIAQGGYGRREMNPWSDVDLLVMYPGRITPYVETINELLIQTLFDAGLQVGWAVRTARECLTLAKDLTIKTTLLDGRFICGSTDVGAEFASVVQEGVATREVDRFIEAKLAESRSRHARNGGSVFMLEPDVKEGTGGLRDLHTLQWAARVTKGVTQFEGLPDSEVLSEQEFSEMSAAREYIHRVRNSLHFLGKQQQDKLSFESQDEIAGRFGYAADDGHSASELFMRAYYSHAAKLARITADATERLSVPPAPRGLVARVASRLARGSNNVVAGQLVADASGFEKDPVSILSVFSELQRSGARLAPSTREAIRGSLDLLDEATAGSREAIDAFMAILGWNRRVYRTLAEMNRLGVLGRLVPEFGRLFCMVQHDIYHVYTVDEHSLIGIRELELVRDGELAGDSPMLTQIMRECRKPEVVYLAMLFHDLGKGYGGDHDERGAVMVKDIGVRLRLSVEDRSALEFLVRHHLLMSKLAQTRDIEDEQLVSEFAAEVGGLDRLKYLYLLTFADMRAVGPKVWNGWKDHLLSELYLRTAEFLERHELVVDAGSRLQRVKDRVRSLAASGPEEDRVSAFLASMPQAYLLSNTPEAVFEHRRLHESLGQGLFRSSVSHFADRGYSEMTLVTPNRPGLFAGVMGVLSAHGLNIANARIATSTEGVAVDTFRVDHASSEADATSAKIWEEVRKVGEQALQGQVDVEALMAGARNDDRLPVSVLRARRRATCNVEIDNAASQAHTVIDIYAFDRAGLLFDLAAAFLALNLEVHLAKVTTYVDQVMDVFYVSEHAGGPLAGEARIEEVRRALLGVVRPSDDSAAA